MAGKAVNLTYKPRPDYDVYVGRVVGGEGVADSDADSYPGEYWRTSRNTSVKDPA
jgi:hypothetical protein